MAARKKRALTPEEQLKAALVPESEWPYEVPDNWCWTRIRYISRMQSGKSIKAKDISNIQDDKHPYACFGGNGIRGYVAVYNNTGHVPIVGRQGALCGNVNMADGDFYATEHAVVTTCNKGVNADWLFYALTAMNLNQYATATAQPGLAVGKIVMLPIALPPTAEQRRIVSYIEWLFSKLDDAEAELREVIDSSKQRETAVLHKAFSGELTESWRKERCVGRETWSATTLADVCSSIFDGDHMPPPKADVGIPFLVISNVNDGYLSFENTRYVPERYYNDLKATRKPRVGDVLYTLVGSYGIPVMVDDERPFCFQRHMALLKPDSIEQKYLWYLLRSQDMFEKATAIATGTAQLTVPIKGLRKLGFECPSIDERNEIVRRLDALLLNEERIRTLAQNGLESIALTRQSVLAKALRGELGTNDPDEPSSKELLASIINVNVGK